jgi:hypothetical protein
MQGAQDLARKSAFIRQRQQSRLVDQNHDLFQAAGGMDIHFLAAHRGSETTGLHFLAGESDRRPPDRQSQTKPAAQQLAPQMRAQRIMFPVKNHPARGDEVDLATKITRLQLHGLQIEKMAHGASHPLDALALDPESGF